MSEHKNKEKLLNAAAKEMERWGDRPIILQMDITKAMVFCGGLQLALRHPEFQKEPSAQAVREFVFDISNQIPEDFPAIRELIKLGNHPRFDE